MQPSLGCFPFCGFDHSGFCVGPRFVLTFCDVRPVHIQNLLDAVEEGQGTKLAHGTCKTIEVTLSAIFSEARNLGLYDGTNPTTGVRVPRTSKTFFIRCWMREEDFLALECFSIEANGDALEKHYWCQVKLHLPAYEAFWRHFVILLTNRIVPSSREPIRLRSGLPTEYELLVITSYSTFYNFVGAFSFLPPHVPGKMGYWHPEPFFNFLAAARECAQSLVHQSRRLLRANNRSIRIKGLPDLLSLEIKAYRNTFAHKTHLGRSSSFDRGLMPRWDLLPKEEKDGTLLWSHTDRLNATDMVEMNVRSEQIWREVAGTLNEMWSTLDESFTAVRSDEALARHLGYRNLLPLPHAGSAHPTQANAITASGAFSA